MDDLPERIYVTPDCDDHLNPVREDWSHGEWLANAGPEGYAEYLHADHVAALLAEERLRALADAYQAEHDATTHPSAYGCREAIRAISDAPAREVTVREASPCGGCGESDPRKRCIGCLHDFGAISQGGEA